jgi:hypothetical protein
LNTTRSKISILDYLFVFTIIVYAGAGTKFVKSFTYWSYMGYSLWIIGFLFPILFAFIVMFYYKIPVRKNFILLILAFTIHNIIINIKFGELTEQFYGIWVTSFFIAYILISRLRDNFFVAYERIIYFLSIIASIFWILSFLIPETISEVLQTISLDPGDKNVESNIIFYTVNAKSEEGGILHRNAGFAWEPGAFACYLSLAIFINLIRNNFKIKENKKLLVLLFALLTTQSTTGYFLLIVLGLFYLYNLSPKKRIIALPIALTLMIITLSLPFMLEKIEALSQADMNRIVRDSIINREHKVPQRIVSLKIDFQDFLRYPIIGYGGYQEARWTWLLGADVATISGIGKILARFGIVGTLFFLFSVYKSSKTLQILYNFKGSLFFVLIILLISISYSIIENPLAMSFWLFFLFYKPAYFPREKKLDFRSIQLNKAKYY